MDGENKNTLNHFCNSSPALFPAKWISIHNFFSIWWTLSSRLKFIYKWKVKGSGYYKVFLDSRHLIQWFVTTEHFMRCISSLSLKQFEIIEMHLYLNYSWKSHKIYTFQLAPILFHCLVDLNAMIYFERNKEIYKWHFNQTKSGQKDLQLMTTLSY